MLITVGSLAQSGPCSKSIDNSLYLLSGRKKTGFPKPMSSGEPSKLGTALHEIVQRVLLTSAKERGAAKERMLEILTQMRNEREIPIEVMEILDSDFLVGSYESKMIQDIANKGITLLHNSFNLLSHLEENHNGSESQWDIQIEHCLHADEKDGPYFHTIFAEPTELRGYIDVVFTWNRNVVLGEIKSGNLTDDNRIIWSRQISAYVDIWNRLYENYSVKGYLIHGGLYRGYREVSIGQSPLKFNHQDSGIRIFNEGCSHCDLKAQCPEYDA
jgi:hypothetical protein